MNGFEDLLSANQTYAASFADADLAGSAAAGVAILTCMDSRIEPLRIFGLELGDAKVVRNPGGRVTPVALEALILAANLLGCRRIVIMEHTRCAVASNTEDQLRERVTAAVGVDASEQTFRVIEDQAAHLAADVETVRSHPLIPDTVEIGGFMYDVDTGLVTRLV